MKSGPERTYAHFDTGRAVTAAELAFAIAEELLKNGERLDELVPPVKGRYCQIAKDSPEAHALLEGYRPGVSGLGRIFSTGLAAHSRDFPQKAMAEFSALKNGYSANEHLLADIYAKTLGLVFFRSLISFVDLAQASSVWGPMWRRWADIANLELKLDSDARFENPKAVLKAGGRSAITASTQIAEYLGRKVKAMPNGANVDLPLSMWNGRRYAYRLAAVQPELSSHYEAHYQAGNISDSAIPLFDEERMSVVQHGNVASLVFDFRDVPGGDDVNIKYPLTKCAAIVPTDLTPVFGGSSKSATVVTNTSGMIDLVFKGGMALAPHTFWKDLQLGPRPWLSANGNSLACG